MDPRAPLYDIMIPRPAAIKAIDDWMKTGKQFEWGRSPVEVAMDIFKEAGHHQDNIPYHRLLEILDEAKTDDLVKGANRGINWVRLQWKTMALRIYNDGN